MQNILTRYYIYVQPDRKKGAAQTHPVNDSKTCNTAQKHTICHSL